MTTPTLLAPNLWGQQIDAQERLEDNWRDIQEYMIQLMNWAGTDDDPGRGAHGDPRASTRSSR